MTFAAISKFEVVNGMAAEVASAFRNRPHLVDGVDGFIRMEVLVPQDNSDEFWLLTWWRCADQFKEWHNSKAHKLSHSDIPKGLRLNPKATEVRYFDKIAD